MSFTDPAVQPPGQGGEQTGGASPYQPYLEEIPEEHRGLVEPAFKRWDGDVTRRFQEAAQYRQRFEPFEQAGLDEYAPEDLAQLVQFAQMAEDPDQFKGWLQQQAQQHGLVQAPPQVDDLYGDDPAFQSALEAKLGPLQQELEELRSWRSQQDLSSYERDAEAEIEGYLEQLGREHGDGFDREAVEKFLPGYIGELPVTEAIDRAFADYRGLLAQVEQQFVARKTGQPNPPVVPGSTNANPPAVMSKDEARKAALQMVRQANQA